MSLQAALRSTTTAVHVPGILLCTLHICTYGVLHSSVEHAVSGYLRATDLLALVGSREAWVRIHGCGI